MFGTLAIREYLVARDIGKPSPTRHSAKSQTVARSRGLACGRLRRHSVTAKQYCLSSSTVARHFGTELGTPKPAVLRFKRDERAQQFAFRSHDAKFSRVDLDALGDCAKVIASRSRHACACGPFGHTESASWQILKARKRNRARSSRSGRTGPRVKTPRSGERGVFFGSLNRRWACGCGTRSGCSSQRLRRRRGSRRSAH
jgi:hypothetical protein